MVNFADRLIEACKARSSLVMVGIDPRLDHLPEIVVKPALKRHGETLEGAAEAFAEFGRRIIDAVADVAVAVKPQSAFFEMLGPAGMVALREVIGHARQAGLLVVADVKRSDIGSTAEAYAQAYLGAVKVGGLTHQPWAADAVTVNPYLGSDGLDPFIAVAKEHGRGVFVLVKTSNPSSGEIQDLKADGRAISERVATWLGANAGKLAGESGYSSLGAVVGATYPEELARLRNLMPKSIILIPGYGAQGGAAKDVKPGLNPDGLGAVVNASRSVIFAFRDTVWASSHDPSRWADAVRDAAVRMRDDLNGIR
jgi:orotidine-5'-phosphate decarboxylase